MLATGLTKKEYLDRGIVVFLIVFTLLDLAYRMPCCLEETDIDGGSGVAANATIHEIGSIIAPDNSETERHTKTCAASEGCFCCAHALPGSALVVPPLTVNVLVTDLKHNSVPSPPSNSPFHPPRLA